MAYCLKCSNSTTLPTFPEELLLEVTNQLQLVDLLSICETDRHIRKIHLKTLQSITFDDLEQIVDCCKMFLLCPEVVKSVKELQIVGGPYTRLKQWQQTLADGIRKLANLQSLNIVDSQELFSFISNDAYFPHLTTCALPCGPGVDSFLKRHSTTISHLRVLPALDGPGWECCEDYDTDWHMPEGCHAQRLHMPNLKIFAGPLVVAYSVIPYSKVHTATIYWGESRTISFRDALAAFAQSTVPIVELRNIMWSMNTDLLVAVAEEIPQLKRLLFRKLSSAANDDDFLENMYRVRELPSLEFVGFDTKRLAAWSEL
ncbi:hypothetical protein R3P38DRAFT_2860640 [Favolaschia claudopus]|uniref:F-box domain-containing protein n=1 Tax=Favolaschia claudopus TaxID=2862362 RepID=A0AAW0DIM1_9AGAR